MLRRFLAILALAVPVLCLVTASAAAATRFVAATGSDEAGNTCLSSAEPCQTVQRAITEAEAGDTLSLAAGTYVGEFQLDKELTLVGQGPSTLLEGEPTVQRPVFIRSNVALENLRIRGGLDGPEAMDAIFIGGSKIHVSLENVIAEQAPTATEGRNAVYLTPGNTLTMKDSTITGVGTTCLWVGGSATLTGSTISMTPGLRGGAALRVAEGGTADLVGMAVTDSGEKVPEQGERGEALSAEGGTVTATDSTFVGARSVVASAATLSMTGDKITAHEAGLVLHGGATAELRDSLIAPPPGEEIGADVLTETESLPVAPTLTIVGSTLYANGPSRYRAARAILVNSPIDTRIVNTILRADEAGTGNAADIETEGGGTWSVTDSAYTTVFGSGPPLPGSGTNDATVPVFAGQGAGNYELTSADAALLGAGDPTQVIPGETDLAGQPRVLTAACDGAPDIGAYEFARMNSCPSRSPGEVEQTSQPQGALDHETPARPAISGVRVKESRHGPALEFRLSEPATVTVMISKAIRHRAGKSRRTSSRSVARFTEDAGGGSSVISLTPHLGTVGGTPGVYRLTVIATANGLRSARHTATWANH
jgi:hypothetical protein